MESRESLEGSVSDVYESRLEMVDGVAKASDVDGSFARFVEELVDGNAIDIVSGDVGAGMELLSPGIVGVEEVTGDADVELMISSDSETIVVPGISVDTPCESRTSDEVDSAAIFESVTLLVMFKEVEISPSELKLSEEVVNELCDAIKLADIVELESGVRSVLVAVVLEKPECWLELDPVIIV